MSMIGTAKIAIFPISPNFVYLQPVMSVSHGIAKMFTPKYNKDKNRTKIGFKIL